MNDESERVAADVPDETKKRIDEIKTGPKDGSFSIWKGPITDNTGEEEVATDAVADDKFLGGVNFSVKGRGRQGAGRREEITPGPPVKQSS